MNRLAIAAINTVALATAGAPALGQTPASPGSVVVVEYGFGPDFWRGAPEPVPERLMWLDMWVKHGIRDGTITRSEAGRVTRMLDKTRAVEARLLARDNGQLSQRDSDYMQPRLDNMSTQVRWAHTNGVDRHTSG